MVRILRGMLVLFAAGSIVAMAAREAAAVDKPCTIATKGDSPVAKACASEGLVGAKRAMRDLVKAGKKAGTKFECDDCHKNDVGYDLTAEARDKFKKLLAAVEGKKP
jgi:hypothetical protein